MNRQLFTIIMLCCFTFAAMAQQQTLTGTIRDEIGEPLPGVTVLVKGSQTGTVSNVDGEYSISVSEGDILSYSFIGYLPHELEYYGQSLLNVNMKVDIQQLDEVVVVGYGTMRKSDVTGSVASVNVEESFKQQVQTVDQLLKGRVSGVQMVGNDGAPNAGISIKIRGASSLRGNNEPLYVVDGVIMSSANEDAAQASTVEGSIQQSQNGLNGINPRDIKSMEILKDASATAIYGSRGANGVVLITTKKGTKGETKVSAYASTSFSQMDNQIDVLRGVDYARYRNESSLELGEQIKYEIIDNQVYPIKSEEQGGGVDATPSPLAYYQDELYSIGRSYSTGASISGGGEKGNHYMSFGYNDLGGITENANLRNGNLRINLDQRLAQNLHFDARLSGYYGQGSMYQDADQWGGNRNVINSALTRNPIKNSYEDNDQGQIDPVEMMKDFEDKSVESRFIASLSLKYDLPVDGLSITVRGGGNLRDKERRRWYGPNTFQGELVNASLGISQLSATQFNINNLLNYNKTFSDIHRVNAVAGVIYEERNVQNSLYAVENFATYTFTTEQPSYGQNVTRPTEITYAESQLLSYMGRVNYSLKDKYVVTATIRADGSSKFSKENRYSVFPSFALAWRASEESFFSSSGVFDDLKVRVGWGQIGNQAINPYATQSNYNGGIYSTPSNGTAVTFRQANIANEDLKWETTEQTNVGLDFGFFNNRVVGTLDAYEKRTKDLLQFASLPGSAGFPSILVNRGDLKSKGLEAALNVSLIRNNEMTLEIGGNIAFTETIIDNLGSKKDSLYVGDTKELRAFYAGDRIGENTYNIFIEGEEIGLFYGFRTDGIYQAGDTSNIEGTEAGDIKFVDLNGDGQIDSNDRTVIGNPNPDFTYGANISFTYKRFSLSAQFDGVYGNEIAIGSFESIDLPNGTQNNITVEAYEQAWRPNAESNSYPRIGTSVFGMGAPTDRIISDGSYFRLNNVTIGYDLPLENLVNRCHVYVAGSNLFTITDYRGYTPIMTSFLNDPGRIGVDWANPPNARSITIGLSVNF